MCTDLQPDPSRLPSNVQAVITVEMSQTHTGEVQFRDDAAIPVPQLQLHVLQSLHLLQPPSTGCRAVLFLLTHDSL